MKWLIGGIVGSIFINLILGYLVFKPRPEPEPQYIFITNQNTLPIIDAPIHPENNTNISSFWGSVLDELNMYHTNSFAITNYKQGYAEVRLVDRVCQIPLPKTEKKPILQNIAGIGISINGDYYARYERLVFNFSDVLLYGGIFAGISGVKTPFLGVSAAVEF